MDNLSEEVIELIEIIKRKMQEMNLDAEKVFLNGNCGDLYKIFVSKFPKHTTPFLISYDKMPYHIITRIQDKFYDITGETDLDRYIEYIKKNNGIATIDESKFEIEQLSVANPLLHKMCGMYRYNEEYEESEISNEMHELFNYIKTYDKARNEP